MEKRRIFFYLLLDFHVKAGTRFSLRDKRLFEISEVEITRVNCLFCHCLFLISSAFGASGRLCFVTVAFFGHFHYGNAPIQIYRKFHLQKLNIFR